MRFTGTHYHSMDNKGRVSIPPRYREILQAAKSNHVYLTSFQQKIQEDSPDQVRYLIAFPANEWEKIGAMFAERHFFNGQLRNFQRYIYSKAEECPLDRQGRILVPPILREYAKLSREVCLVGAARCFEIWDRAAYEAHSQQLDETFDEKKLDALLAQT